MSLGVTCGDNGERILLSEYLTKRQSKNFKFYEQIVTTLSADKIMMTVKIVCFVQIDCWISLGNSVSSVEHARKINEPIVFKQICTREKEMNPHANQHECTLEAHLDRSCRRRRPSGRSRKRYLHWLRNESWLVDGAFPVLNDESNRTQPQSHSKIPILLWIAAAAK